MTIALLAILFAPGDRSWPPGANHDLKAGQFLVVQRKGFMGGELLGPHLRLGGFVHRAGLLTGCYAGFRGFRA